MSDASESGQRPRCPQCRSVNLTLVEFHQGAGCWSSDEWHITEDGRVALDGDGWSESAPTGRWDYRCEDCDHQWKRRAKTDVTYPRTTTSAEMQEIR